MSTRRYSPFKRQDVFLGLAIWGSLDPTNVLIPPAAAPWAISFA